MKSIKFLAVVLVFAAVPAFAQSPAQANLDVTANVAQVCSISTLPVAFGEYDPLSGTALDAAGAVSVACTRGATNVRIDLHDGGNFTTTRRMAAAGPEYLEYELFKDAARSQRWGTVANGLAIAGPVVSSAAVSYTVYGRVPAGQDAAIGNYADVVLAEIHY